MFSFQLACRYCDGLARAWCTAFSDSLLRFFCNSGGGCCRLDSRYLQHYEDDFCTYRAPYNQVMLLPVVRWSALVPAITKSADEEGDANYYAYFMDAQKQVRPTPAFGSDTCFLCTL